jgi:hypothetical protein
MMEPSNNILIGVTSWTGRTLIDSGEFYPRDVTTAEALRGVGALWRRVRCESGEPTHETRPSA